MTFSVNDNIFIKHMRSVKYLTFLAAIILFFHLPLIGQTNLGNESQKIKITPFSELLQRPVKLKPELKNVHPRLFFTAADLPKMRERAKGADKELWQEALKEVESFGTKVPDPMDEDLYSSGLADRKKGTMTQYSLAFRISQFSFAYVMEGDEKYLDMAKKLTLAACEMPIWGYKTDKPNVDLPPAHLLYAVAFSYDVLFDKLTNDEKTIIKNKLIKQGRLMYEYFQYKPNKRYTYSQNHTWIPLSGLAIAAYALMDETPEAQDWARLARAVFDRTMLTFGTDGYYYESFHYYGFAFRWIIRYFDAHLAATGENLYEPMREKFAGLKYFAMHSILPDRENVFDFADIGDGALNRNKISKREKIYGEYDILYRLAGVYQDSQAQTVADFTRTETDLGTREPMWAFISHDPKLEPAPLSKIPTKIHFVDNDTVYGRTDWSKTATAFAFRCSPPEGHHAAILASKIPDWRENTGHAHPDANSFIIFAGGKYLTGDTGYLGIKETDDHNTILVNGRGQANDGVYEMFKDVSNEKLNNIRIVSVSLTKEYFYIHGEASSGYYDDLKLKKFDRHFLYVYDGNYFVVWDELEADKPSEFTFMLNADREIKLDGNQANLINENVALRVIRIAPNEADSKVVEQIVQARGLPGSVSEGDAEQRGVQLQTTSAEKAKTFKFLHFLQPIPANTTTPAPKFEKTANGLKIMWSNGVVDLINFDDPKNILARTRK